MFFIDENLQIKIYYDRVVCMDRTDSDIETSPNYIKLRSCIPFFCKYVFLDTGEYLSDHIFEEKRLWVSTGIEFIHESNGYRIVFCRILRWQRKRFLQAMEELYRRMLLTGHTDYQDVCREFSSVSERKG